MAVDAVMSMMGTGLGDAVVEVVYRVVLAHAGHSVGLGDAVVEAVLPGWEAINAGGHAMEAHA